MTNWNCHKSLTGHYWHFLHFWHLPQFNCLWGISWGPSPMCSAAGGSPSSAALSNFSKLQTVFLPKENSMCLNFAMTNIKKKIKKKIVKVVAYEISLYYQLSSILIFIIFSCKRTILLHFFMNIFITKRMVKLAA